MSHVDYEAWFVFIQKILSRYLPTGNPSILEIGGGTGTIGKLLKKHGVKYFGSDVSFHMCAEAHTKDVPFICSDARHIPIKTTFDLLFFLYDGINYLIEQKDYSIFFKEAALRIRSNGLLLFDITTRTNSMKHFQNYMDYDDLGDCAYIRHSYYEPTSYYQFNDFTLFRRCTENSAPGLYNKFVEHHIQKVYTPQEIINMVPKADFEIEEIWDSFSFRKFSSRSERIHFLLRKI
jgi:ubiquinone/menaquinone biosynthesis C-methylase UbiE